MVAYDVLISFVFFVFFFRRSHLTRFLTEFRLMRRRDQIETSLHPETTLRNISSPGQSPGI